METLQRSEPPKNVLVLCIIIIIAVLFHFFARSVCAFIGNFRSAYGISGRYRRRVNGQPRLRSLGVQMISAAGQRATDKEIAIRREGNSFSSST